MDVELTLSQKLEKLGLQEHKNILAPDVINILYQKYLDDQRPIFAFELLNLMFEELGYNLLDDVADIGKCRITVADIKDFDSKKFLLTYKNKFKLIGLDIEKDFNLKLAETRVKYGAIILEKIISYFGYKLYPYHTQTVVNGIKKNMQKYKFVVK